MSAERGALRWWRIVLYFATMLVIGFVAVIAMLMAFGVNGPGIAWLPARTAITIAGAIGVLVFALPHVLRMTKPDPALRRWFVTGAITGLWVASTAAPVTIVAHLNGRFGGPPQEVCLNIVSLSHPTTYVLEVEDWTNAERGAAAPATAADQPATQWLMWGPSYPEGWDHPAKRLRAQIGKGLFGLTWINKQRIGRCRAAASDPGEAVR